MRAGFTSIDPIEEGAPCQTKTLKALRTPEVGTGHKKQVRPRLPSSAVPKVMRQLLCSFSLACVDNLNGTWLPP